jgi:hypothetical protein
MATIDVERIDDVTYRVTVEEGQSRSVHEVTADAAHVSRYAPGTAAAELIEASFRFLLEREPKESILARFELPVIERYFPEYPRAIQKMVHQRR